MKFRYLGSVLLISVLPISRILATSEVESSSVDLSGNTRTSRLDNPTPPPGALEVSPASLYLGHIRPGEKGTASVRVRRADGNKIMITKTEAAPGVVVRAEPADAGSKESATITASVEGVDGLSRNFSSQVKVYTEDNDSPALVIPIQGRFLGEIVIEPEKLEWNVSDPTFATTEENLREAITRVVYIYAARQGQSLDFPSVSCSLTNVDVGLVTVEKGRSYNLVATLTSLPNESIRGFIMMETNLTNAPVVNIPITIDPTLARPK